ncbi:helix-turn-helix domain-containing protein [Streptomyces uncialis]|uniref:helix-turn-helix domain-containing protein n=1 Tax=Streptomyces uncialis TaxID=1048205 RepID=UPI00379D8FCA
MGRKEKPVVDKGNRFLVDLALWLRAEKARTGKSYRELAELADRHPTTLQRAAFGNRVPRLPVVMAFAKACDAPPEEARRLWRDARYEETVRGCPHRRHLCLACIGDAEELRLALREVHHRAGMPSPRVMERHAGPHGILPRSTAYRISTGTTVPRDLRQFRAYLRACEVPEYKLGEWELVWWRVSRADASNRLLQASSRRFKDLVAILADLPEWVPDPRTPSDSPELPEAHAELLNALLSAPLREPQSRETLRRRHATRMRHVR